MGIRWLRGVLVTGCLLWAGSVQAQTSAQLYEQALRKERTEGDLPAAIALYQRVAAGADRELAARALIRAGELYERSGQQEAVKTYRRVVSEFADQQEPARTARERLAALEAKPGAAPAAGGLALRQVTGNNLDPSGMPSADGHYLTFTDWSTGGNLALFDLVAGTNRQLTRSAAVDGGGGYVLASAISRDGKRIAYYWAAPPWVPQVRIINSDGSGERVLFANQDTTVGELQVHDFTPDGQAVAVVLFGPAGLVRFGLLSTADGSFQVLRRLQDAGYPLRMAVSPDGKWIAYDEIVDTITVARDVVIVARDGVEKARISHPFGNQNPIWTPDGRHLLFSSARSGELGLWAARVTEGVAGNPVEVKSNMPWGFTPMGFAGDRLLYLQPTGRGDVFAVEFDQQAGRVSGTPVNLLPAFQGMNSKGVWTRDGRKLVYASRRGAVSTSSAGHLVVRDVATGQEIEYPRLQVDPIVSRLAPSPDGRYVVAKVRGLGAVQQLQLYDTHTGATNTLAPMAGENTFVGNGHWAPDGGAVFFAVQDRAGKTRLVRYDIATRTATRTDIPGWYAIALSPAGDSVAVAARTGNRIALYVGPATGGEYRQVAQLSDFGDPMGRLNMANLAFTPDGKRIVFGRTARTPAGAQTGDTEVFTVPVSGGEPQTSGLALKDLRTISFAPDGRLTFTAEAAFTIEIWSIENIASRLPR